MLHKLCNVCLRSSYHAMYILVNHKILGCYWCFTHRLLFHNFYHKTILNWPTRDLIILFCLCKRRNKFILVNLKIK